MSGARVSTCRCGPLSLAAVCAVSPAVVQGPASPPVHPTSAIHARPGYCEFKSGAWVCITQAEGALVSASCRSLHCGAAVVTIVSFVGPDAPDKLLWFILLFQLSTIR
jgi:hypothetical protein